MKVAAEPPDEEHPYGHGKAEPLASVVVALIIIAAAIGLAVQSVHEIITPHHAPAPFTLAVLVGVIIIKETLFRKVSGAAEKLESTAVKTDAWHHRADVMTSTGAFIGISIAIIGGKGWEPADDWAALFTCGIIGFNGYKLLRPALLEVMDTAPPKELVASVRTIAEGVPGVGEVEKCHIRKMGLAYYVDIHIGVDADMTVRVGHEIGHAVKDTIRTAKPQVVDVLVHIEPVEPAGRVLDLTGLSPTSPISPKRSNWTSLVQVQYIFIYWTGLDWTVPSPKLNPAGECNQRQRRSNYAGAWVKRRSCHETSGCWRMSFGRKRKSTPRRAFHEPRDHGCGRATVR